MRIAPVLKPRRPAPFRIRSNRTMNRPGKLTRTRGRLGCIALVVAAIAFLIVPRAVSQPAIAETPPPPAVPQGVWLMEGRVAVQIFECEGLMCGRVVWLLVPRDPQGLLDRD